jgi:SHS2 domain-containing protein
MRRGYKYISHTADVEFLAYGSTLEESFQNAMLALFETIAYTKKVSASKDAARTFTMKVKADTIEKLLWYTLQDAISILGSRSLFAYRVSGLKINNAKGYALTAKVYAKKRRDEDSKLEIKGVSMYELKVEQKKSGFVLRAVVDV